jgi:CRISPR-associated endonuclease/helicase Cas3
MSMVIPFRQCKARPDENNCQFLLTAHLSAVARSYGCLDGPYEEQLYFLGGLCHDAAKGRKKWQENLKGPRGSRPPHAAPGALLYSFYAAKLLEIWEKQGKIDRNQRQILRMVAVRVSRDIFDHHRELGDIEQNVPWSTSPNKDLQLYDLDLAGFQDFLKGYFDEFNEIEILPRPEIILSWEKEFRRRWLRWSNFSPVIPKLCSHSTLSKLTIEKELCIRNKTACFISADRLDAARILPVYLDPSAAQKALLKLKGYCQERAVALLKQEPSAQEIIHKRISAQAQSLQQYLDRPSEQFYALSLPTGLGKTLTSLRLGLEACARGKYNRIIYAAPYISILSQATKEIRDATGLEVLQHHHLAVLTEKDFDDKDILISESWQAPVVTTTFNQTFRALFPYRAQDTVRMPAMEKAFLIIDEPQIIDSLKWNLFLAQLQTATQKLNCQTLFISATLPPFDHAGIKPPYELKTTITVPSRYQMQYFPEATCENDITEDIVKTLPTNICPANSANLAQQYAAISPPKSVCAVMNTVQDACTIYLRVKEELQNMHGERLKFLNDIIFSEGYSVDHGGNIFLFNLNGLMTPVHKEIMIDALSHCLQKKQSVAAISTQIIEAGVDLSFKKGLRARALHPCHVQFAGRSNRHGEGDTPAVVKILHFLREKKIDSRQWVYTSSIEREETDKIMQKCEQWDEVESLKMLDEYYKATFARNPNTTLLNFYSSVALGRWSLFAGIEPFEKSYPSAPVFIPWPEKDILQKIVVWYQKYLPDEICTAQKILGLMERYGIGTVEEIYESYTDPEFRKSLDFVQRKLFMALLQQFQVAVGEKMLGFACQTLHYPILRLIDENLYSLETGLARHVGHEDRELYF